MCLKWIWPFLLMMATLPSGMGPARRALADQAGGISVRTSPPIASERVLTTVPHSPRPSDPDGDAGPREFLIEELMDECDEDVDTGLIECGPPDVGRVDWARQLAASRTAHAATAGRGSVLRC